MGRTERAQGCIISELLSLLSSKSENFFEKNIIRVPGGKYAPIWLKSFSKVWYITIENNQIVVNICNEIIIIIGTP